MFYNVSLFSKFQFSKTAFWKGRKKYPTYHKIYFPIKGSNGHYFFMSERMLFKPISFLTERSNPHTLSVLNFGRDYFSSILNFGPDYISPILNFGPD